MENSKLNLATMAAMFADESKAREWLESKRWPTGPVCPHCACLDYYKLATAGRYKCKGCKEQYTVRIGTILEESKMTICGDKSAALWRKAAIFIRKSPI